MTNFINENEQKLIQSVLKNNGVIAFPTDTVWGIGCLVENRHAIEKIYSIKERDKGKPLILLGKNLDSLIPYINKLPDTAVRIADKYLPGAVTLVIEKNIKTPDYITSGFKTVGIRVPDCPPFIELLDKCTETGVLATTSANMSNEPACYNKDDVIKKIGNKIDYLMEDYGFKSIGTDSTVVSVDNENNLKILRQGAINIKI